MNCATTSRLIFTSLWNIHIYFSDKKNQFWAVNPAVSTLTYSIFTVQTCVCLCVCVCWWFSDFPLPLVRNLRPAHTCGGDNQLKWLPLYVRTLFRLFTHGVRAPPPVLLRNIIVTKVIAGLWAIFSFHLQSAAALVFAAALVETGAAQAWSSFLFIVKFTHTQKKKHHLGSDVMLWESSDLAGKSERHLILWPAPSSFLFTEKILPAAHTLSQSPALTDHCRNQPLRWCVSDFRSHWR